MAELAAPPAPSARQAVPDSGLIAAVRSAAGWLAPLLVVLLGLAAAAALLGGLRPLVVLTGSMRPTLEPGDLVISARMDAADIRKRQIITFARPGRPGETLTHRVTAVRDRADGRRAVVTRGDANDRPERWSIPRDGNVGRHVTRLPGMGAVAQSATSPLGRTIAIWLLAAALIAQMLRAVWRPRP